MGGLALFFRKHGALAPRGGDGPAAQLLIHLCAGWLTAAVVSENGLRFWRTRKLQTSEPALMSEEVIGEVNRVLASARDSLQVEVERIWFCERPRASGGLGAKLGNLLGLRMELVQPGPELAVGLRDYGKDVCERFGAPLAV